MRDYSIGKLFTIDLKNKKTFYFYNSVENAKNFLHLHYSPLEKMKNSNKNVATLLCIDEIDNIIEDQSLCWKIVKVLLENQTFFMYLSNIKHQLKPTNEI